MDAAKRLIHHATLVAHTEQVWFEAAGEGGPGVGSDVVGMPCCVFDGVFAGDIDNRSGHGQIPLSPSGAVTQSMAAVSCSSWSA